MSSQLDNAGEALREQGWLDTKESLALTNALCSLIGSCKAVANQIEPEGIRKAFLIDVEDSEKAL